ncbi:gas vesicle protein GvpG [Streptomyces sp. NPDC057580]|uniref:gas vesicle protein GvpG n=1 Tax=Streptomyces sp. NPDC057580 TaxID=3346173 RepID=UPI00367AE573
MEAAERDYYDPGPVERELAELEKALLSGAIDEETFEQREDERLERLDRLDRLDEIKAHQEIRRT